MRVCELDRKRCVIGKMDTAHQPEVSGAHSLGLSWVCVCASKLKYYDALISCL